MRSHLSSAFAVVLLAGTTLLAPSLMTVASQAPTSPVEYRGSGRVEVAYRGSGRVEVAYRGSGRVEESYRGSGRVEVAHRGSGRLDAIV